MRISFIFNDSMTHPENLADYAVVAAVKLVPGVYVCVYRVRVRLGLKV